MLILSIFVGLFWAIIAAICGAHWTGVLAAFAGCTAGAWHLMVVFSGCDDWGNNER